ncbi:PD-(D/E)XK nuclease family protein [Cryomorphaceae bacterium 1068]|nr:PD-(D/E)XK nuclease family protein [Cryomorphaceae bacterium 1068]
MQPFLGSLAECILQNDFTLENQVIILPTKRSANFLTQILADRTDGAIWLPEMLTFNEWASQISGLEPAENLLTSFALYEAYAQTMGAEAQSLSEFLSWSSVILSDFNDIDAYLIDPNVLFKELIDYTEIDQFSFLKSPLSEKQESYRRFWRTLPNIFNKFKKRLLENKIGTSGMIMRAAAEMAATHFSENQSRFITVAGFNALTNAEVKLLKAMEEAGIGKVYFDADDYLMSDHKNAGRFIKKNLKSGLGEILKPKTPFTESSTKIQAISAAYKLDQANAIAAILEKTPEEDLKKTGLILADESMLMPVIERLPESIKAVNVTMGLSLGTSSFRNWVEAWMDVHITAKKTDKGYQLNTRRLLQLLNHPFSSLIGLPSGKNFSDSSIELDDFEDKIGEATLLSSLQSNQKMSFDNLKMVFQWTLSRIKGSDLSKPEVRMGLLGCEKVLETIDRLIHFERSAELDLSSLRQIFVRVLSSTKLSLLGEPMQGLQIMGVLETRALGFENLILCSVDEGNFPKNNHTESFIPFEVRLFHKLPARREKEAVFAYQFYRLLSHSKSFSAIYHTDSGTFSGGEMSRYLMQVREDFENENRFSHINLKPSELFHETEPKSIEKTEEVIEIIKNSLVTGGLSASSINRFFESSLEWYYSNILSLAEPETNEIDHSTFGIIVHDCLEKLFQPYEKEIISKEIIEQISKRVRQQLSDSFHEGAGSKDYSYGVNRLHFETALKMIQSYLNYEKDDLTKGDVVEYLESERRVEKILKVEYQGEILPVRIKGYIDRIERRNDMLHIIDFKTGNVEASDLNLSPAKNQPTTYNFLEDKLKTKGKALQLLLYDWLLYDENKDVEVVNQIISLAAPGKRDLYLNVGDRSEVMDLFEEFLRKTVLKMLDSSEPIEASEKFQYAVFE